MNIARLTITSDEGVRRLSVTGGTHVIGRDPGCDVVIKSIYISRQHARLTILEKEFLVEELAGTSRIDRKDREGNGALRYAYPQTVYLGGVSLELQRIGDEAPGFAACEGAPLNHPAEEPVAGRYKPGAELARGGMGAIVRSEDVILCRDVAMKVMLQQDQFSRDARARFEREARIMARLGHPNIVPVHDLGLDEEGRPFYIMKEVKGRNLQEVLNSISRQEEKSAARHSLGELLRVFLKACDGVSFAHSKGVVHRDLKPENIMIGEYGEVLVMDWGLAKDLGTSAEALDVPAAAHTRDQGPGLTMEGAVMGTPHFMSPEQAEGRIEDIDQQSDVFLLGAILYSILTLNPPAGGKTTAEVLENVKGGNIRHPSSFNTSSAPDSDSERVVQAFAPDAASLPHCPGGRVPASIAAVAMKALNLDKSKRYACVSDLATEVGNYLEGKATEAEQASPLALLWMWVQRNKASVYPAVAGLVCVALVALGLMGKVISSERTARAEASKARMAESAATNSAAAARLSLGKAQVALAQSAWRNLDSAAMIQALEACPTELRNDDWRYYWDKRTAATRALTIIPGGQLRAPVALPGMAGQFAAGVDRNEVVVVDAFQDRVSRRVRVANSGTHCIAASGDGLWLAVVEQSESRLSMIRFPSAEVVGVIELQAPLPEGTLRCRLNQDGTLLALSSQGPSGSSAVYATATGKARWRRPWRALAMEFAKGGDELFFASATPRFVAGVDAQSGQEKFMTDHYAFSISPSPDGKHIAAGVRNGTVLLLNPTNGSTLATGRLHESAIYGLSWSRDGRLVSIGDQGKFNEGKKVLRVWDVNGFVPMGSMFGIPEGEQFEWSFDPGSGLFLTTENPPVVRRVPIGIEQKVIHQWTERGWSLAFASEDLLIARSGYELGIYSASKPDRQQSEGFTGVGHHRMCAVHWESGSVAVMQSHGKAPEESRLYQLTNGALSLRQAFQLPDHVKDAQFDPASEKLLCVFKMGDARVWSLASTQSLLHIPTPAFGDLAMARHVTGDGIVAVALDRREVSAPEDHLLLYDTQGQIRGHVTNQFRVHSLAVSSDGSLVAVAGTDQCISLYQASDLKHLRTFRAHDKPVTALAFHPRKPILASASMDHSVKFWDYANATPIGTFLGPTGAPNSIAFSPSGEQIAVDGEDHFTRIWRTQDGLAGAAHGPPPDTARTDTTKRKRKKK